MSAGTLVAANIVVLITIIGLGILWVFAARDERKRELERREAMRNDPVYREQELGIERDIRRARAERKLHGGCL